MTVESVTYISDLNATYPAAGDNLTEGDDHIRNIKTAVKASFTGVTGAVTTTHTVLNNIGLVLLASQSASSSATIDFTTGIDSTYEDYELHIVNAVPASSSTPWLRTTANAGSSYDSTASDYGWTNHQVSAENGVPDETLGGGSSATRIEMTPGQVISTTAYGGLSAVVRFSNPAGTSHYKLFTFHGTYFESASANDIAVFQGAGARIATAAINGVRFMFSTGNIASGLFKLYGVKKS